MWGWGIFLEFLVFFPWISFWIGLLILPLPFLFLAKQNANIQKKVGLWVLMGFALFGLYLLTSHPFFQESWKIGAPLLALSPPTLANILVLCFLFALSLKHSCLHDLLISLALSSLALCGTHTLIIWAAFELFWLHTKSKAVKLFHLRHGVWLMTQMLCVLWTFDRTGSWQERVPVCLAPILLLFFPWPRDFLKKASPLMALQSIFPWLFAAQSSMTWANAILVPWVAALMIGEIINKEAYLPQSWLVLGGGLLMCAPPEFQPLFLLSQGLMVLGWRRHAHAPQAKSRLLFCLLMVNGLLTTLMAYVFLPLVCNRMGVGLAVFLVAKGIYDRNKL